jgi:hypothetical protein
MQALSKDQKPKFFRLKTVPERLKGSVESVASNRNTPIEPPQIVHRDGRVDH